MTVKTQVYAEDDSQTPLVYVFLGSPLPKYAFHSLRIARQQFRGPIVLLTDQSSAQVPRGISCMAIEGFYSNEKFTQFQRESPLDPLFRRGFWLKAVERFFVLEQYAEARGFRPFFHAELDVMILDLTGVAAACNQTGGGLFAPVENRRRAIASLIYFNTADSIASLVRFIQDHPEIGNEMKILGHYMSENQGRAFALRGDRSFDSRWPYGLSYVQSEHPLIDSSGFGQWILGQDPRNILGSAWNLHKGAMNFPIEKLRFWSDFRGRTLNVSGAVEAPQTVGTLHIHSKVFRRLRLPFVLMMYTRFANLGLRLPVRLSLASALASLRRMLLRDSISQSTYRSANFAKPLVRLILKWVVERDRGILSNRERRNLNQFFPTFSRRAGGEPLPCVNLTEIEPLPAEWSEEFHGSRSEEFERVAREAQILLIGSKLDSPHIFHDESVPCSAHQGLSTRKDCVLLFLSSQKGFEQARHASAFWNLPRVAPWSFITAAQVISPELLRKMFPSIEDIFEWMKLGYSSKSQTVSAFQSYGNWVYWKRSKRHKLVYEQAFDLLEISRKGDH